MYRYSTVCILLYIKVSIMIKTDQKKIFDHIPFAHCASQGKFSKIDIYPVFNEDILRSKMLKNDKHVLD